MKETQSAWITKPLFRWSVGIIAAVVAGIVIFEALGISVFQKFGFAHGYCYLRNPKMIWTHVISDLLIGGAYVSISATLAYLVYKASKNIPFNWVFLAFGLFIVSCGFTHFMEVWVIWQPVYWLSGYVKVVTAAASLATAIALFPLLPKVFALINSVKQAETRRQEIERLNTELERFNYSVAHDLRAPLRAAAGLSQVVSEDYAAKLDAAGQATLKQIQSSMQRMDAMLTDLLKYTGVTSQTLELKSLDLRAVLDNALNALRADIAERNARVEIPTNLPPVFASDTLLSLVFQNLIGNAIKFVQPGVQPIVRIEARAYGERVAISVADNGIGIPIEQRERVFKLFERLDLHYPGTGIGLAIVHRAVERMHGTIELETAREGSGIVFIVTLPTAPGT
ncbi:MAG TPA: ATP-binding protein, partial [Candidatus Limnocylindria bacterium]|nr:ATP-binding protein [Candidatus Limnocylindria bacterium]